MKRIILFVSLLLLTYVNSNAGNIPVGSPSALTADFSASVTSGCAPLVVAFTSTSTFNAGDPIVSYTWDFGDGTTITTPDATPSHTYTTTDPFESFTVTLTVTSQSSGTHSTAKSSFITIYEKPVFSMGNDTSVCADGGQLYFTLPSGYDSYSWSQGTATTPFASLTPATGVNIFWGQVTSGTCVVRDTIIVTGIAGLTGKFGYQILNTCGTIDVQFYDSSFSCDPLDPANYWEWVMDEDYANGKYGEQNPVYSFSTGGTHTISYSVMNNGEMDLIDSTITLPNPTSGPAPVDLGPDKNICVGGSIQFDAGSEPGATYVWTPVTGLSSTSVYNPVASPLVTTTYTVTKTKCGIEAAPASVTVNVNPPLVVNLGPDQTMCTGGTLTLDAGVTEATYQWGSTYSPAYAFMTAKTVIALGPGSYWVTVTKNGCVAKDTIVITAKPAVDPMFTYMQTGFCGTLSVGFTDASIPCSGSIVNYVWDFGDGSPAVSGDNPTISHNYATAGTYHVTLTVTTSGAVTDSYEQDIIVTGGGGPVVDLGADAAICAGGNIVLDAGNPGATYSWSTGESTQTIT
ncbi:PKD domain-containing protein, partial [Agriterribacter sp.]|uniref:PKD domain-containing protein n=1 Tax=Agriterribacter sp. TaxID=2821509 RepID=UPI002CADBB72